MINNTYKQSYNEGLTGEINFKFLAEQKGFIVHESTKRQNIYDHIDFFIEKNDHKISFDVKAKKRVSRHGSYTNDFIWIELTNVNGFNGWINGIQDFIAFEFDSFFIIVKREILREFVYSIIDFDMPYVFSAKDALHRLYQRKGRKDCITIITYNDLIKLNHRIWNK
jgi:hypothetical protein